MKQQVIEAFQKSTINNQQIVKSAEDTIKAFSATQNYCLVLMEIIDDQTVNDQIRMASLIQLKNNIERRWIQFQNLNNKVLSPDEKLKIKQTLLTAMIRCNLQSLIKLYKAIVTLVISYQHSSWMPTEEVCQTLINQPENINITILFIESVVLAFSQKPNLNKSSLEGFLKPILPLLYQIVTGERKSIPLIYLIMKALQRIFKIELSQTVKQYVPIWMPLIKQVIDHTDESLLISNCQQKNSIDSCFFRAKKWAARIISKFFQTHASWTYNKANEEYAKYWNANFALAFLDSLAIAITKPNLPKTNFYILKSFSFAAGRNPGLIQKYCEYFLYTIIPQFVKLVPEDQKLSNEDPLELIKKQQDVLGLEGNPKAAAINLWTSMVDAGSDSKKKIQGPNLRKSLQWIYQQLSVPDLIINEMAMNLLCRVKFVYVRFEVMKQPIVEVIQKYVVPLLSSEVMLVKARAIEVFQSFGYLDFSSVHMLQQIVESLYKALMQNGKIILNIKAACAFNTILRHKAALDMLKPYLRQLLQCYLKLITQHEIQNLVSSLQGIVQHYGQDIGPFAVQLITYLSKQFIRFQQGNNENTSDSDEGQLQLAASACLDVMKQIVDSNLSKDVLPKIQDAIIQVLEQSFTHEGSEYYQYALVLLSIYLYESETITPKLWFFYPCILYNILGLPQSAKIQEIPIINHKQQRIFSAMPSSYAKFNLYLSINCIRNFIFKSPSLGIQQKDMFGNQMLATLLKIFQKAYHAQNREPEQILNCVSLVINIFQNTRCSEPLINIAWQIMSHTLKLIKSITGRKISYQLFALMLLSHPDEALKIIQTQAANGFETLKFIMQHHEYYQKQYQISRMVKGFSCIFIATNRSQKINTLLPLNFMFLVRLISKLASVRRQIDLEDDQQLQEDDAEDTNYWDQERENCRTNLDRVDAVMFFEMAWKRFTTTHPNQSAQLKSLLSADEASIFEQDLISAKKDFFAQNSPNHNSSSKASANPNPSQSQ